MRKEVKNKKKNAITVRFYLSTHFMCVLGTYPFELKIRNRKYLTHNNYLFKVKVFASEAGRFN